MIHAGIDLHANNMVIVAINDNGDEVRQAKLPSNGRALEDFFATFDEPVQAVVECTCFWYWLADWCTEHAIPLKLAHAKMVKAISYAKVKTDKVDAKTLAELIPEAYQVKPERRELRELTRGRLRLIQWRGSSSATAGCYRELKTAAGNTATSQVTKTATSILGRLSDKRRSRPIPITNL